MTTEATCKAPALGLDQVSSAERPALIACWTLIHGVDPPKNLSLSFLRQAISFELQAKQSGGLSGKLRRQITRRWDQLCAERGGQHRDAASPQPPKQITTLQPGARLVRDWNGKTWVVDVTEHGFEMQGQSFASLTAIAKKITGAHWSGPRFFGLNRSSKPSSKAIKRKATA